MRIPTRIGLITPAHTIQVLDLSKTIDQHFPALGSNCVLKASTFIDTLVLSQLRNIIAIPVAIDAGSPPHRWLRKIDSDLGKVKSSSPPHRWLWYLYYSCQFLSHLCGGEQEQQQHGQREVFLSHLCGGEPQNLRRDERHVHHHIGGLESQGKVSLWVW
jgi:hypothetical protein